MMESCTKWLASYYETDTSVINNILNSERATSYLLVWPILEQELFNGYFKKSDIAQKANQYYVLIDWSANADLVKHFHVRYQDSTNLKHLCHDDSFPLFTDIIRKDYESLSDEEKMIMMFYVVYRFRNNIFHGNKKVLSWKKYTTEIDYCLDFMTMLLDANKNHKSIKEKT